MAKNILFKISNDKVQSNDSHLSTNKVLVKSSSQKKKKKIQVSCKLDKGTHLRGVKGDYSSLPTTA